MRPSRASNPTPSTARGAEAAREPFDADHGALPLKDRKRCAA